MKKITLGIDQIMKVNQAANTVLRIPGLAYQKAYWLGQLRDFLVEPIKKWSEKARGVFEKYATTIPQDPFVPPEKYQDFKKKLLEMAAMADTVPLFEKYEVASEQAGQLAVPVGRQKEYEDEMNKAVEEFKEEIEYHEIEADEDFFAIIQKIPGELQLSLSFMFSEEKKSSGIILPFGPRAV